MRAHAPAWRSPPRRAAALNRRPGRPPGDRPQGAHPGRGWAARSGHPGIREARPHRLRRGHPVAQPCASVVKYDGATYRRSRMSDYAVINPATGETAKTYPTITDDELQAAIALAYKTYEEWGRTTSVGERAALVRRVGELHSRAARGAGRDRRPRDGQADGAGAGRGRLLRRHLRLLRRQRRRPDEGRADQAARGRRHGGDPPQPPGRAARHHAVELPHLSGRPVRGPEPDHRQHGAAQARTAVPGDRRGPAEDLPRRRFPGGRLHQHLRHQRPDREP